MTWPDGRLSARATVYCGREDRSFHCRPSRTSPCPVKFGPLVGATSLGISLRTLSSCCHRQYRAPRPRRRTTSRRRRPATRTIRRGAPMKSGFSFASRMTVLSIEWNRYPSCPVQGPTGPSNCRFRTGRRVGPGTIATVRPCRPTRRRRSIPTPVSLLRSIPFLSRESR